MALWVCEKCGTKYTVGAEKCPHCGGKASHEDGEKATRKTGKRDG